MRPCTCWIAAKTASACGQPFIGGKGDATLVVRLDEMWPADIISSTEHPEKIAVLNPAGFCRRRR